MVCIMAKKAPQATGSTIKKRNNNKNNHNHNNNNSSKITKAKMIRAEFKALESLLPKKKKMKVTKKEESSSVVSPLDVVLTAIEYIQQLEEKLGGAGEAKRKFFLQPEMKTLLNKPNN